MKRIMCLKTKHIILFQILFKNTLNNILVAH
jgi:hypothetical protein